MGMLDQFKMASEMMKNMSPEQVQQLMKQAADSKAMMDDVIAKAVAEEIQKRGLVSRSEVEAMIAERLRQNQ